MSRHAGEVEPIGDLLRARRRELGLSQAEVAEAVGVLGRPTVTRHELARWERGKRIPRPQAREGLAQVLDLPARLLHLAAGAERARRSGSDHRWPIDERSGGRPASEAAVGAIRAALLDHSHPAAIPLSDDDDRPPRLADLRAELAVVMGAYQASRYGDMLQHLPELLAGTYLAAEAWDGPPQSDSRRLLALAHQAAAMVLTKLGEHDLAWIAADRGLTVAGTTGDAAVVGSLSRSVVHTLQSHGRTEAATRLAERAADQLRLGLRSEPSGAPSVYGTLLLAGAMASARARDPHGAREQLDEAGVYADLLGRDANHLWTAFGPTNVAIHRVATSVALGDIAGAYSHAEAVDPRQLPVERRVRYAFDLARVHTERGDVERAVAGMLAAERLAPEQVHHHLMSHHIVIDLRSTPHGRRNDDLAGLARRIEEAELAANGPSR